MILSSPAFNDGEEIPTKYSYKAENVSPPLLIDDIPPESASLAMVCHDPDAPRADGFTHWVMWNIEPSVKIIKENSVPLGAMIGLNDWGDNDWGGPAPPSGIHRYIFYLYALNSKLDISQTCGRKELLEHIEPLILESATLTGLYRADSSGS